MDVEEYVKTYLANELQLVKQRPSAQNSQMSIYGQAILYKYSADGHSEINPFLRDNQDALIPDFGLYLKEALEELPVYQGMVYRSVNMIDTEIHKYEVACKARETITEPFFVSTSKIKEIGEQFGDTFFRIVTKSGRRIDEFSRHQAEQEVLIPCGAVFRIKAVTRQYDGLVVLSSQ